MKRLLLIPLVLLACTKNTGKSTTPDDEEEEEDVEEPVRATVGGETKYVSAPSSGSSNSNSSSSSGDNAASEPRSVPSGKPAHVTSNGNGSPALRKAGNAHGPGGPVFMGRGKLCTAERDHCMRPGVWFQADNLVSGKLFRAVPAFELEGTWYRWDGREISGKMFRTEVATANTLSVGDPVIFFAPETSTSKFTDTEYDALTSSRWKLAVVEKVDSGSGIFRVKGGYNEDFQIDIARVIVERR